MALKTSGGNAAFHNFHNDYAHIQDPNERRRLALAEVDKVSENSRLMGWQNFTGFMQPISYRLCTPLTRSI